ncbi:SigE family RNA polymerase sigma factor [Occultella kanbiaonis]|uniref:SigE family RNA polymerase sigma factor n=1 Tax=Occultella kanbiaonis TaxID=2675754 RepID=UPI0012B7D20E|nr:SigE family RNA polymerase sigma factor [Occultella kanbiaonis]
MVQTGDRAGDSEFEDFVRTSSRDLARFAWVLTLDRDEASDLLQEALARTYARWPTLSRSQGDPYPYVRRILVNLRTDRWRKRQRQHEAEALWSSRSSRDHHTAPDPGSSPDDGAFLAAALSGLTTRQRRVVALRYLEDLSVEETATTLGMSQAAVKMAASRAATHLRTTMGGTDR